MKSIKLAIFFMALTCTFISCSKNNEEDEDDCENDNTCQVTFRNVWENPIRVQVASQLTPQFEPIAPIVTLDLEPGQSVTREIPANRYSIVWKNGCPNNCSLASNYQKTYETCAEYTEQLQN